MKVLIAEDDVISSRAIETYMNQWGYETTVINNGEEAWQAFQTNLQNIYNQEEKSFRIAILDWEMPGMNGIDLCKKIRRLSKQEKEIYVYIILLTGKNSQEEIIKGLSSGADDYITKPFDTMELRVRLKNAERIILTQDRERLRATTDNLTQIWSRNKILEFLKEEVEREGRYGEIVGLIMIDIDFFKKINDNYGHPVGDQVLRKVADRLKNSMRRYDKIGRYGGDEFIAVFPRCGHEQVKSVAERLRKSICRKKINTDSGPMKITVSIGGTCSQNHPSISSEELIKISDKALMLAKKKGRNNSMTLPLQTKSKSLKMSAMKERNEKSPIDLADVLRRIGNDKEFLYELLEMYRNDFPVKIKALKKSIIDRNFRKIQEIGHYLKGSSANLSLTFLENTSFVLECAGKEKDIEKAKKALQNLNKEFDNLNKFIIKEKQD